MNHDAGNNMSAGATALVFCPNIGSHRQLYACRSIEFFLDHGFATVLCAFGGRDVSRHWQPWQRYESMPSPHLEAMAQNSAVRLLDLREQFNRHDQLTILVQLQTQYRPSVTFLPDGDGSKNALLRQLLPWRTPVGAGTSAYFIMTDHFHGRSRLRLRPKEIIGRLAVELQALRDSLFFKSVLPRRAHIECAFCADEILLQHINSSRYTHLPELGTEAMDPPVKSQHEAYYQQVSADLTQFLQRNAERDVLLQYGELVSRKGFDFMLRLAEQTPDSVCVRSGRSHPGSWSEWPSIYRKEKLIREQRYFDIDVYVDDPALIDQLFGAVRYVLLPYRNVFRTSGVMTQAIMRGLPVLAPDMGIMAHRVREHRLGRVFKPDCFESFRDEYHCLRERYREYLPSVRAYAQEYSRESVYRVLRRMMPAHASQASPATAP